MIIGLDIDGVIADLHPVWYAHYNKDFDDNVTVDMVKKWNVHEYAKGGIAIYQYLKDRSLYDTVLPYSGALEFVLSLFKLGDVVYVTASPPEASGVKYFWLKRNGFPVSRDNYVEVTRKKYFHGDILIDDYEGNLLDFTGLRILFDKPWNRAQEGMSMTFYRMKTYKSVLTFIKDVSGDSEQPCS